MTLDRSSKKTARQLAETTGMSFTAARRELGQGSHRPLLLTVGFDAYSKPVNFDARMDFALTISGSDLIRRQTMMAGLLSQAQIRGAIACMPVGLEQSVKALKTAFAEVGRRRILMFDHDVAHFHQLPAAVRPKPMILFLDEIPNPGQAVALPIDATDWERRDNELEAGLSEAEHYIVDRATRMSRVGQSVGVTLCVGSAESAAVPDWLASHAAALQIQSGSNSYQRAFGGETRVWESRAGVLPVSSKIDRDSIRALSPNYPFAVKAGGEATSHNWENGHLLVAGFPGSGKTTLLRLFAAEALLAGDQQVHILGQDAHEFDLYSSQIVQYPGDSLELADKLETLAADVGQRIQMCEDAGVQSIDDLPKSKRPIGILLLADGVSGAFLPSIDARVGAALSAIVRDGRRAGVKVVISGQDPTAIPGISHYALNMDRLLLGSHQYAGKILSVFRKPFGVEDAPSGVPQMGLAYYEAAGHPIELVRMWDASSDQIGDLLDDAAHNRGMTTGPTF